jgi:hypothetical protein
MMLQALKQFFVYVFRDRTQSLEEYILAHNPQTSLHVEQLEQQYYARMGRNRMI